ncbi:hypothetical protein [Rarobacter faecitabidus]|uniref:DUF2510 domain-containing protein n=1 Tax=Rarobacter faecitabidus TaxID=13243 RepID=A0A542ZNV8_RARFA|nr:hypothetical protein [Rarobacter faecitabidus]TQL62051.1 hypothetical protein FB461_1684 [Rarobacter faecitabidus]
MTSEQIPPGLYANADGVTRLWDGKEWLTPAVPAHGEGEPAPIVARKRPPRRALALVAFVVVVVLCGTTAYIILSDRSDRRAIAAAAAVTEAERIAAAERVRVDEAQRVAEEERVAAAEVARKEEEATIEKESRAKTVKQLEKHVLKTARKRVKDGYYSEKVRQASCMAVAGSSIEDLAQTSTTFSCLAVTSENEDGTNSGYELEAVINWSTGEMSWG